MSVVVTWWSLLLLTAVMMAGYTAEYVNSVLAKVAAGDNSGGLSVDE